MKNFRSLIMFCVLVSEIPTAYCQQINIYSIGTQRQTLGDKGYTLDGTWMKGYSRAKLLNTFNFGTGGIYPKPVVIIDSFATTGSLTAVTQIPDSSIFFFGSFNKLDASFKEMTDDEIDSLYKWSKKGGKLMICEQPPIAAFGFDLSLLDSKWGFSLTLSPNSSFIPTAAGTASGIFNGPFGTVSSANQGGSSVGYINLVPANSIVLAENLAGKPTLILDCNTLDLITADVDGFTGVGGITYSSAVDSPQDKFWANTIAWMDKLETTPSPVISQDGNELSAGNYYVSYQWYLDGVAIPGAQSSSYTADGEGEYTVEVTFQCGCIARAPSVHIIHECLFQCNNLLQAQQGSLQFTSLPEQTHLTIYNVLGQQLYYSSDYQNNWMPPNAGAYIYEVKCESGLQKRGKIVATL